MQNIVVNIPTLQIDTVARAVFRQEAEGSYPRLNFFVVSFIMFVAATFQRTIKRYFLKGVLLAISVAIVLPILARLCH